MFAFFISCSEQDRKKADNESNAMTNRKYNEGSFGYDLNYLSNYQKVVVLKDASGKAQVLVCPQYQGRVMTSTASGAEGPVNK